MKELGRGHIEWYGWNFASMYVLGNNDTNKVW